MFLTKYLEQRLKKEASVFPVYWSAEVAVEYQGQNSLYQRPFSY